jgi:dienelactone hydrolase
MTKFVSGRIEIFDKERENQNVVKTLALISFAANLFAQTQPPYSVETVQFGTAGTHLAGALTLPAGKPPFPAVLLVGDAGSQDRDETASGHNLELADYLARREIAVLRVDKPKAFRSVEEQTTDALAGIVFLKGRSEIDAKHIGIIGHGHGGNIAASAALRSRDVAFLVMLATPVLPAAKEIILQNELALRTSGAPTETVDWRASLLRQMLAVVKDEKDPVAAEPKLRALLARAKASLPDPILDQAPFTEADLKKLNSQETRSYLSHDPAEAFHNLKTPVLALYAARDFDTPWKENSETLSAALKSSDNNDHEITQIPGVNHLFEKCDLCTPAEYAKLKEPFSPTALQTIAAWILSHTKLP